MSKKAGFLSVTLMAGLVAGNLGAVPMNVSAKGNDSNEIIVEPSSNKKDTPITNALKQATDGTVIYLKSGEYHEQLVIDKSNVTIKGLSENGQKPYINGEGLFSSKNDVVIKVKGSNVVIDNIEIKNFKSNGPSTSNVPIGIKVYDGVSRIKISNCDIHDTGVGYTKKSDDYNGHGILVTGYDEEHHTSTGVKGVVINNCHLYNLTLGNSEAMVLNGNVEDFYIYDNLVEKCDNIGIDFIGYENEKDIKENVKDKKLRAEYIENDSARDGFVYNNVVSGISSGSNCTYHGESCAGGIYVDGGHNIEIHDNYVEKSDIGIELASEHENHTTDKISVTNNILYKNNALAGISIGGSFDDKPTGYATNCIVSHNTVYSEDGTAFNIQRANDKTNVVTNNVFYAKSNANLYENEKTYTGNKIENNLVNKNEGPASSKNSKDIVDTSMKVSVDSSAKTASVSSKSYKSEFGGVITWNTVPSLIDANVSVPAFDEPATEPVADQPVDEEPSEPVVNDPVVDDPSTNDPVADDPITDNPDVNEPVTDEPVADVPSDEEPSWDIHTDSSFYTLDESDDTCKISFKKKKSENWEHVNIDFGDVDLSKYSTVKITVVPSRKSMNLGITNQDEDNPIFYRNHWKKEGKFTSAKKQTISVALTEENKNGLYLYFDATSNDTYKKSQTAEITDIWFE
ncbi:MAG: hypothetical protein IKS48_09145 [Eubacterium sp.]|nr:hypothetical protein [Eubacterium sp.]